MTPEARSEQSAGAGLDRTAGAGANEPCPVAIVGLGAIFPGASDVDSYWQNIVNGIDAITTAPPDRFDPSYYDPDGGSAAAFYCNRGGFVDATAIFDPTDFGIMPVTVETAEPDQLLVLRAASQALHDAGNPHEAFPRDRSGVVLGRGGYLTAGLARLDQRVRVAKQLTASLREILSDVDSATLGRVEKEINRRLGPEHPESAIDLVPNLAASRTANRLDLHGPAYTIDAACASSLVAVERAVRDLQSNRCDVMVAGGTHHCHDVTLWSVFTQLQALSHSGEIRPLDARADGLLIGEGTGVMVLMRLADALDAGNTIYAVIAGCGVSSDGRGSLMKPSTAGQVIALERAWQEARRDPATIGLLEAHGTATSAGDDAEIATLRTFFGERDPKRLPAGIGSVKSMIGHAMPAAGAAGLVKAALAVHHGILPPTLHCEEPNPLLDTTAFRPVRATEPWDTQSTPRVAAVDAFGFGGINAHIVLEQAPAGSPMTARPARFASRPGGVASAAARATPTGPTETGRLLRAEAPSAPSLLALLDSHATEIAKITAGEGPLELFLSDRGPATCRLAVVNPTPKRLETARRAVARGRPWPGRNDIWFADRGTLLDGGKVAFVFPGVEPIFEPRVEEAIEHFGLSRYGLPPAGSGAPSQDAAEMSALESQGRAIIAVGRILDAALASIGVRPDVVAGHSIGEWSGMISTEMIPPDEIDEFIDSLGLGSLEVPGAVFAAVGASAGDTALAITGIEGVAISHDNCPHQSVICGTEPAIAEALERLSRKKTLAQVLPFRSGFHSPIFADYLPPFIAHLARLPLAAPRVPLWSATTCSPYPSEPREVRELAARHLVEPVRFRDLTTNLYEDGARVFIQCGSGSLPGFIDDTLRDKRYVAITAASPKQDGLSQLLRVASAVWVEGAEPHIDALFTSPRSTDTTSGRGARPPIPGRTSAHAPMSLALGAPLLHIDRSTVPAIAVASQRPDASAAEDAYAALSDLGDLGDPILAELGATIHDAVLASQQVVAAWRERASLTADRADTTQTTRTPDPLQAVVHRRISVEEIPALRDHCFYRQPDGWPSMADRYPVVPMTALIDIMAEAATSLCPGQVVVAIESIRALRWLVAEPPTDVVIRTEIIAHDRVQVSIEGYARAVFVMASDRPEPPQRQVITLSGERPAEIDASQLYRDRWLFHGPSYQGVIELGPIAEDGIRGVLRTLEAPGALLDNAGQLMGYWIMVSVDVDRLGLPMTIERIRFFGPDPLPGEHLACVVHVRDVSSHQVKADLELYRGTSMWALIEGWVDRRFESDATVWPVLIYPERSLLAEIRPAGYAFVTEHWTTSASRELMMRRYLGEAERLEYATHDLRGQRHWLLGRIAAKDAVRDWLWKRGYGPIYPVEITITNDEQGRPHVTSPFAGELHISIAHTSHAAVAAVSTEPTVGVDIEKIEDRSERFTATTLSPEERKLWSGDEGREGYWLTRMWAAKEAAAKCAGTGLIGKMHRLTATLVDGDRILINGTWVHTEEIGDFMVAWTLGETDGNDRHGSEPQDARTQHDTGTPANGHPGDDEQRTEVIEGG